MNAKSSAKFKEYKTFLLEEINRCCPSKKKTKYSNEYYLDHIFCMLNNCSNWSCLPISDKNNPVNHYKTIYKKFQQWSKLNIFETAYSELLSRITRKHNKNTTLNLFIDSTLINNEYGSELTNYGSDKKKKHTKVSFVADANRIVYGVTFYKASTADVTTINSSMEGIIGKFKYRKINLTGDKGYISEELKKNLMLRNIKLMYPHRRNMKKRTPKITKKWLKRRYTIENCIRDNKRNLRISLRKDRSLASFKSFMYISLSVNFFQKQKILENKKLENTKVKKL